MTPRLMSPSNTIHSTVPPPVSIFCSAFNHPGGFQSGGSSGSGGARGGGGGSGTSEKPILGALGLRRFSLHLVTLPPNCFAHNLWLYIAIKQLWLASD
jgi:hypothetical protein